MSNPANRNIGIDCLRLLAALAVVILHTQISLKVPAEVKRYIFIGFRFAVPVFFIISGYALAPKLLSPQLEIATVLSRLAKIFLGALLLYLPLFLVWEGAEVLYTRLNSFSLLAIGTGFHLWFVSSLFFGLLMVSLINGTKANLLLPAISFSLLILCIGLNYYQRFLPLDTGFIRYLNSIPLIYFGMVFRKIPKRRIWDSDFLGPILLITGILLTILEVALVRNSGHPTNIDFEFSLGIILTSIGLFLSSLNLPKTHFLTFLATLGRRYSLGIYIIHVWILVFCRKGFPTLVGLIKFG